MLSQKNEKDKRKIKKVGKNNPSQRIGNPPLLTICQNDKMSILLSHVSLFHAQGRDDAKKRKEFWFVNCNVIQNRGEINTLEREITQFCFCWTYIEGFYLKSDYSDLRLAPFDIDKYFLFFGEVTPFSCDGIILWGKRCSLMGQRV